MEEENIPAPKKIESVKGEVLMAFLDKEVTTYLGVDTESIKQLSLSNLSVNLKTGEIHEIGLSFLPCLSLRVDAGLLVDKAIGKKEEDGGIFLQGEWEIKDGKKIKVFEIILGDEKVFFIDNRNLYSGNPEIEEEFETKARQILIRVLESVKDYISCNYAKYFVNNCLIVEEDHFQNKEQIPKLRADLYSYINAEIKKEVETKSQVQQYLDNFAFRPFYGPAIMKLPEYNQEIDRYDWDGLYINVEQTKKELSIQ